MILYKRNIFPTALVAILLSAVLFTGCNDKDYDDSDVMPAQKSIGQIISLDTNFTFLSAALKRANLASTLEGAAPLTVFAPSNAAFGAAGIKLADIASLDPAVLAAILSYHVVNGAVKSTDIQAGINKETPTLAGTAFVSNFSYGTTTDGNNASYGISVNGSRVTRPDIMATNGIVHVVDAIIIPPRQNIIGTIAANSNLSLLNAAIARANLAGALSANGPLTLFAPTNDAFKAAGFTTESDINAASPSALAAILTYHVRPGRVFSTNFTPPSINDPQAIRYVIDKEGKTQPANMVMLSNDTVKVTTNIKLIGKKTGGETSITQGNITATNGVVHIIDKVLLP
jgi:uncharacterized surface protein with fasciclin (FAS1) repeats